MMPSVSSIRQNEAELPAIGIGIPLIPFDLFVTKTRKSVRFTDAFNNLVYESSAPHLHPHHKSRHVLFDPSANSLISLLRSHDGSWKALKGDGSADELLFKVDQTLNTFSKTEFNVIGDFTFTIRGCCFWRSCTIYNHHHSLVAQTNLMYKLGFRKHFVSRSKFRVTIFPGFADYTFIASLILIFLEGRK
ncbi:hypothetical protein RND81_03G241300 [Saponaria officinalis]|uniref:Uncharacterized protein n=1 Tax=Saponaria officinalis TaxID=3572 RepID=A0AAW1MBL3_SAPOF